MITTPSTSINLDDERKLWESDNIWLARRTFMKAHLEDIPLNQLRCLSQLFINVNMIGCEYEPTLMERIRRLGAGIMDRARILEKEGAYVKASQGRAKANEVKEKSEERSKATKQRNGPTTASLSEKLKKIRSHLQLSERTSTPLQMLNFASVRAHLAWQYTDKVDGVEIRIDDHLIFKRKFILPSLDAKELAVTAVVETFLEAGEPEVIGREIHFGGKGPLDCYCASVTRSINRSARHISNHDVVDMKKLESALAANNLVFKYSLERLKGWEQQLQLSCGDVVLTRRILKKGDCVKPKVDQIVAETAQKVANVLCNNPEICSDANGLLSMIID